MTSEPERIAAGLTEAQRVFIQALDGIWRFPRDLGRVACPSNTANRDRRLVERPCEAAGTPLRLTPLGQQVRAILQGESK